MTPVDREHDWPARLLELGLCAVVLVAPLPFGAVGQGGRLGLEIAALLLGLLWVVRAAIVPTLFPPRLVIAGLLGLVALGSLQLLPTGASIVGLLSPRSAALYTHTRVPAEVLEVERRMLGVDPVLLEPAPSLSVDPVATASALRTGVAIAVLLLVATTVGAARGPRGLALALLLSASFQGLYGLLVLASGYDMVWNVPKPDYLDSATGTFINRNHFAGFLAMSLPCGAALIVSNLRRHLASNGPRRLALLLAGDGARTLLLGLLLVIGLAGLLTSFSRAGTALGLAALLLTLLAAGRRRSLRTRVIAALLVVAAAVVPLVQIGAERLVTRYSESAASLASPGGRGRVWLDTLDVAAAYPLAGSGFGTFAAVYPQFRSPGVRLFYAHAHNDLLQALAEGGVLGLLLLAMVLVPLIAHAIAALGGAKGTVAAGFAAGLLAVLLHGLVDFNFHIPANAATAAILAGALLGRRWINRD